MRFYFLMSFLFCISHCLAQPGNLATLDQMLDKSEKKEQWMGSLAYFENGKTTYARAIGYAELSSQTKADTITQYRIGSISKLFTATMIMQLVEEKKLNLDDPLSNFFPLLPNAKQIKVEHLLRHESGIYNFGKSQEEKYRNLNPKNREETLAIFESTPLAFIAGEKYDYNNANYVLLSLLIEELDQNTFAACLEKRILAPYHLTHTQAGGFIEADKQQAHSYSWKKGWQKNGDHYSPSLMGAGALLSTPNDLNRFLAALFSGQIVNQESLVKMTTLKEKRGLGLTQFPFYNKIAFGHSGNIDAFQSFAVYFPKEKLAFTLLLNGNQKELNPILIDCLKAYFER